MHQRGHWEKKFNMQDIGPAAINFLQDLQKFFRTWTTTFFIIFRLFFRTGIYKILKFYNYGRADFLKFVRPSGQKITRTGNTAKYAGPGVWQNFLFVYFVLHRKSEMQLVCRNDHGQLLNLNEYYLPIFILSIHFKQISFFKITKDIQSNNNNTIVLSMLYANNIHLNSRNI
jgi:hypothetical protein